jgi:hypothetical protein
MLPKKYFFEVFDLKICEKGHIKLKKSENFKTDRKAFNSMHEKYYKIYFDKS